jgi:hypothetical protein
MHQNYNKNNLNEIYSQELLILFNEIKYVIDYFPLKLLNTIDRYGSFKPVNYVISLLFHINLD